MNIITTIKKHFLILLAGISMFATSCDFLDVVPVEKPSLIDATKDAEATLGFLYSTYAGVYNPVQYEMTENSVDEFAMPDSWYHNARTMAFNRMVPSNADTRWATYYRYIGQAHLFIRELKKARGVSEEQAILWEAEAKFMIAYYHFELLRFYGPCPILDRYIEMDEVKIEEISGRYHYDYVTDWIVNQIDEVTPQLPNVRSEDEWGRATKLIAKSIKAKALLYAASPLWNGQFYDATWANTSFETPGYGKELVSRTFQKEKWERAYTACKEAIDLANELNFKLYDDLELYSRETVKLPYVPGREANTTENTNFKKRVLMMRYLVTTYVSEGNKELIWGVFPKEANEKLGPKLPDNIENTSIPIRTLKLNNGNWYNGWGGMAPFLNAIERYYTDNGKLPKYDSEFTDPLNWLKSANVPNDANDRSGIINLNVGREPRFYAWVGFDGGDHTSKFAAGSPIYLELRNGSKHGYDPIDYQRYFSETGYLNQKFIRPNLSLSLSNSWNRKSTPRPLIRLAELILNLAECEIALGKTDAAIENINKIRTRAGIPELSKSDINGEMTLTDWLRNEKAVEFVGEGHRFYDLRRWCIAPQYLGANVREGLNGRGKVNPTVEEYNVRIKVPQTYDWRTRMYLVPIEATEVYQNPQLVQAPGY